VFHKLVASTEPNIISTKTQLLTEYFILEQLFFTQNNRRGFMYLMKYLTSKFRFFRPLKYVIIKPVTVKFLLFKLKQMRSRILATVCKRLIRYVSAAFSITICVFE
jgi:hypothetical protein